MLSHYCQQKTDGDGFFFFFCRKPEKGISYLIAQEIIDDSPDNVARFLLSEPGISKQKLGEYLGNLQNPFNMDVLK